jgi:prefoldin subunit 5
MRLTGENLAQFSERSAQISEQAAHISEQLSQLANSEHKFGELFERVDSLELKSFVNTH